MLECGSIKLNGQKQDREPKLGAWVYQRSDHIKIQMKMPIPSQQTPKFSKAPNQYFKDMNALQNQDREPQFGT